MKLTEHQVNFFRTFGFYIFRQLFSPEELKRYSDEFDQGLDRWIEGGVHNRKDRIFALFMYEWTPYICSLIDDPRFVETAEQLLDKPVIGNSTNGNYYVGDTQWHHDGATPDPDCGGVKFAIYLEPLDPSTGALRVIPGSHREPLHSALSRDTVSAIGVRPEDVPAYVCRSEPGDVVAFHSAIWHAAFGGSDHRRMGTVQYWVDPQTPEGEAYLRDRVAKAREGAMRLGHKGSNRYPDYWRRIENPRHQGWVRRLEQMGAFEEALVSR